MMPPSIPAGQLAAEFDAIIRSMPNRKTLHHDLPENHEWLGRAAGLVTIADGMRGILFKGEIDRLYRIYSNPVEVLQNIIVTLQQFKTEWQLKAGGPLTVAFEAGRPFDYFDEVRKIIEAATSDVFVVDPYLGAEFISRYLPHVKPGVTIRLLIENHISKVKPAAELFVAQYDANIEIRKSKDMHDRFIFIDCRECYQSGATFKDGAVKSSTTLTQITDAFTGMLKIYEESWASAKM